MYDPTLPILAVIALDGLTVDEVPPPVLARLGDRVEPCDPPPMAMHVEEVRADAPHGRWLRLAAAGHRWLVALERDELAALYREGRAVLGALRAGDYTCRAARDGSPILLRTSPLVREPGVTRPVHHAIAAARDRALRALVG